MGQLHILPPRDIRKIDTSGRDNLICTLKQNVIVLTYPLFVKKISRNIWSRKNKDNNN